jgi:hypothetical protein
VGRLAVIALVFAGCANEVLFGPSTGASCPPAAQPTYDSFGEQFMTSYCTRCHSSKLMGPDRQGAPLLHDFDTLYGVQAFIQHIDETTASGPDATNTSMPPNDPAPTLAERQILGEWLACGAP